MEKKSSMRGIGESDILDSYLEEMDALVSKYPDDPNDIDLDEGRLFRLIEELDESWSMFQKKWQQKLKRIDSVFATAAVTKDKRGMRHLIIRSEFSNQDVLSLSVDAEHR